MKNVLMWLWHKRSRPGSGLGFSFKKSWRSVASFLLIFAMVLGLQTWWVAADSSSSSESSGGSSQSQKNSPNRGNGKNNGIARAAAGAWDPATQVPDLTSLVIRARPTDGNIFVIGENKNGVGGQGGSIFIADKNGGFAPRLIGPGGGERARATFDSAGNLYVVWQAADTGPMQTYLVKIDPAGNVGPVRNLGNTLAGAGSNGLPDIFAPPGSNRLYLAIEANPQSPTAYESLDGGASWTGAHTLATGLGSQTQPRIVGDANGNITVTYLAGGSISAASRDAAGNWSASQNITPNLGGWQSRSHEIALAQDGSNNVYEVYSSAAPGGGGAGFVMRSGQSGAWLAQQDNVSGNNGNNSNGFGVAATTDGTIWVGSSVAGGGPDTFMVASAPAAGGAQPSFSAPAVAMAPPGGATKASLSAYGPTVYYVSGTDDRHAFETGFTTNGPPAGTPPSGNVSGPATATIGQQPTTYTATITGQNLGAVEVYAIPKGQTGPPFTLIGKAIVGQTPGCGATSCTYSAAWTPPASATAGQEYTIFINGFSGGTDNSSASGKCTGWPLPQPPSGWVWCARSASPHTNTDGTRDYTDVTLAAATATPTATATATATSTSTAVPATATIVATATAVATSTSTPVATATATATIVPATATASPTSPTVMATATATSTTTTSTPSLPSTATATVNVSVSPTPTAGGTATATATLSATATAGITTTSTSTPTVIATATSVALTPTSTASSGGADPLSGPSRNAAATATVFAQNAAATATALAYYYGNGNGSPPGGQGSASPKPSASPSASPAGANPIPTVAVASPATANTTAATGGSAMVTVTTPTTTPLPRKTVNAAPAPNAALGTNGSGSGNGSSVNSGGPGQPQPQTQNNGSNSSSNNGGGVAGAAATSTALPALGLAQPAPTSTPTPLATVTPVPPTVAVAVAADTGGESYNLILAPVSDEVLGARAEALSSGSSSSTLSSASLSQTQSMGTDAKGGNAGKLHPRELFLRLIISLLVAAISLVVVGLIRAKRKDYRKEISK